VRFKEAALWYERVLHSDPLPPESAFIQLAQIQFDASGGQAAEQTLFGCLDKWPRSAEAHDTLAGLYLRTGRPTDAKRHLEQARRLDPYNPFYADHYAQFERSGNK
jgi:Flp pilus assembly protein TadD